MYGKQSGAIKGVHEGEDERMIWFAWIAISFVTTNDCCLSCGKECVAPPCLSCDNTKCQLCDVRQCEDWQGWRCGVANTSKLYEVKDEYKGDAPCCEACGPNCPGGDCCMCDDKGSPFCPNFPSCATCSPCARCGHK